MTVFGEYWQNKSTCVHADVKCIVHSYVATYMQTLKAMNIAI